MKVHVRKKEYRKMIKHLAMKERLINDASGKMIPRNFAVDNSMRSDYYPQR